MLKLERILHVEDDPSIRAVAKVALEAVGGFEVLSCSSGQEALDNVLNFATDLILAICILGLNRRYPKK